MTRFWLCLFGAGFTLVICLLHLPLAWFAPKVMPDIAGNNLSYSGTVWSGSIQNVDLLGTANFKLSPVSIFSDAPLKLTAGNGRNSLMSKIGRQNVEDLSLELNVADLPLPDQRLTNLTGVVAVNVSQAHFKDRCLSAKGTVRTDVLQRNGSQFGWSGPVLDGPIKCADGRVVFDLSGQEAGQDISAHIEIDPAGEYFAEIFVQTTDQKANAVLPLFGFSRNGREFKLTEQGRWR